MKCTRRYVIGCFVMATALAGCSLLDKQPEPDELAKWAEQKGVVLDASAVRISDKPAPELTKDRHGYALPGEAGAKSQSSLYLVPIASIDPEMEPKLRAAIFPAGVATFSPEKEGQPVRKVAESELDGFYLQLMVFDGAALCQKLSQPCAAVNQVKLIGKLKNAPMISKGGRWIEIDPALVASDGLLRDKMADIGATCGFDPERDRVPRHVASACGNLRKLDFALAHGFTLDAGGSLLPLTPGALTAMLKAIPDKLELNGVSLAQLQGN